MSLFGKNIRKIRTVRAMSQQSFAELFDLKRGTLGAYEEGRSEPKIDTLINIANYFSIPVGDLLTKELTVNQLLKFKGDLETPDLELDKNNFTKIPCITPEIRNEYLKYHENPNFINDLPSLNLPINNNAELRGFIVDDLEMSEDSAGFYPKDIVIAQKVSKSNYQNLESSCLFLIISSERILLRRIFQVNKKFILKADHKGIDDVELKHSQIKEMWEVKYTFFHRVPEIRNTDIKEKLSFLEDEFKKLRSSMKS